MNADNPLNSNAVAVFTKYPHPGQVKTRLAAVIGGEKACLLHTKMAYHVLNQAISLQKEQIADCLIFFHGENEKLMLKWFQNGLDPQFIHEPLRFFEQQGDDLGMRMFNAFKQMSAMKYKKMLLMGTDCPEITAEILKNAISALSTKDVIFGPAQDGGYYLIGMKTPYSTLFQGIPWSREDTLYQSLLRCRRHGISYALLSTLHDIDRPEDILHLAGTWNEFECHNSSSQ